MIKSGIDLDCDQVGRSATAQIKRTVSGAFTNVSFIGRSETTESEELVKDGRYDEAADGIGDETIYSPIVAQNAGVFNESLSGNLMAIETIGEKIPHDMI